MSGPCRACGEPCPPDARACSACGARLGRPFPWAGALVGCGTLLGLCLLVAIPNVIEARKQGGEAAPIGALKAIHTSQVLFREGDKDGDGVLQYGTLAELSEADLIDRALGSGTKHGYLFVCRPSPHTPDFLWMATARPEEPGQGDRYFAINHAGVTYYRLDRPFEIAPDCAMPDDPSARPVGK